MHLLGAHMSIEKSHALAIDRAAAFDMRALQIFVKNASRWVAKPIDPGRLVEVVASMIGSPGADTGSGYAGSGSWA